MGNDEPGPSDSVTISAKSAEEAEDKEMAGANEPDDNGGWEAEAESIVENGDVKDEGDVVKEEEVPEEEEDDSDDEMEEEPEDDEEKEGGHDEVEEENDPSGPRIAIGSPEDDDYEDDGPAAATLVVGASSVDEDDELDESDEDDPSDEDEDDEDPAPLEEDGSEEVPAPKMDHEEDERRKRRPLPAIFVDEHGLLDKRVIGALVIVMVLIVASIFIYIVVNKPGELTIPYEQLGDRVTYKVNGNAYFKLHQGEISIPMIQGSSIDESDIDFTGTLTLGTNSSFETIKDGFQNDHTTFARRIVQDLDIDGESRRDGRAPIAWPPTYEKSIQYSYIDTTSLLTIKLISEHNLSYDLAKEDLDWLAAKGVMYVQYSSFSLFIPDPAMYNGPDMKEGECGTYIPDEVNSDALRWCIKEGEDILGHQTLKIEIEPATLPDELTVSKISLWLSEASAYPLKISIRMEAELSWPIIGQVAEGTLRYTAIASDIKHGSGDVPSGTPKSPSEQKHRLAQQQGQFMPWSKDGAPQLGVTPEYSGLDPDFDIQEAVDVINGSDANVTDYLESKPNHYVLDASYGRDGGVQEWNFTMGYHRTNNNNDIKAYFATVTKNGTGEVVVENLAKNDTGNPILDRADIPTLLTLGGVELVLASDDHVARWALIGSGDDAAFDYSKETLYLRENPATPVANLGSLSSSFNSLNLFDLANSYIDGDMDLNDILGELSEGQGGYGYVLTRDMNNGFYTAVVDAESGGLLGVGILKQSADQ